MSVPFPPPVTRISILLAWLFCTAQLAMAADWRLGDQVYRNVKVKQVTPRAVIISHSGGISQVPLAELPPEAQKQFGYDPEAAAADQARIDREHSEALARKEAAQTAQDEKSSPANWTKQWATTFKEPAKIQPEVDLRPQLRELGLFSKSQGRRPSCSVFAVVGALEYQAAMQNAPSGFSEEYAIWATRQYLAQNNRHHASSFGDNDAGFTLQDVIQALRQYGVAQRDAMPNTFGTGMDDIEPPKPELLKQAQGNLQIKNILNIGRSKDAINKITHALNAGQPVVIGVAWPHENTLHSAPMISGQNPVSMHAVTLVGYRSDEGGENLRFVFKNSWGPQWGSGGYGWITADYLRQHIVDAYLLEPAFGVGQ